MQTSDVTWDPARYLQFADHRLRPAIDLLARVPADAPRCIVDLGCGTGSGSALMHARWPGAVILGVDASPAMLERARASIAGANVRFEQADIATWTPAPDMTPELVFSNAALHWLDHHERLVPRLFDLLACGGVLAIQMPDNFDAPSHRLLYELARSSRWAGALSSLVRDAPVAPPAAYHRWLAPRARRVDVWRTEYLQQLAATDDGTHPVVAWVGSTALAPFLHALDAEAREAFATEYEARIAAAYPAGTDGTVLFPFRRLFVVAEHV